MGALKEGVNVVLYIIVSIVVVRYAVDSVERIRCGCGSPSIFTQQHAQPSISTAVDGETASAPSSPSPPLQPSGVSSSTSVSNGWVEFLELEGEGGLCINIRQLALRHKKKDDDAKGLFFSYERDTKKLCAAEHPDECLVVEESVNASDASNSASASDALSSSTTKVPRNTSYSNTSTSPSENSFSFSTTTTNSSSSSAYTTCSSLTVPLYANDNNTNSPPYPTTSCSSSNSFDSGEFVNGRAVALGVMATIVLVAGLAIVFSKRRTPKASLSLRTRI